MCLRWETNIKNGVSWMSVLKWHWRLRKNAYQHMVWISVTCDICHVSKYFKKIFLLTFWSWRQLEESSHSDKPKQMNLALQGISLTLCAGMLCRVWQEKHQHEQAGRHITGGKIPRLWLEDPARHQRLRLCIRKGNRGVETARWSKRRWEYNYMKAVLQVSYDGIKFEFIKSRFIQQ